MYRGNVVSQTRPSLFHVVCHAFLSVSGAQLQSSVQRPCPGERVTFTCSIPSVAHQWDISFLSISRSLLPRDQGRVITDHPPFQFNVTEVTTGTSITSTATVIATADLNGTLVLCRDGVGTLADQSSIINIIGEYCTSPECCFHCPCNAPTCINDIPTSHS